MLGFHSHSSFIYHLFDRALAFTGAIINQFSLANDVFFHGELATEFFVKII